MVANPKTRFLAEDIWDAPDDDNRYEVIDGELYVTPAPNRKHQHASFELGYRIRSYLETHPLGTIYSAPIAVVLAETTGAQPDLVFVSHERAGILTDRGIEGVPDLVVEVLSPSTRGRDRGLKLRQYQAAGVPHYWIADPDAKIVEERVLGPDGYGEPAVFGDGDIFQPTLFPSLEIAVARLWL